MHNLHALYETELVNRAVDKTRVNDRQFESHLRHILGVNRTLTMFEEAKNDVCRCRSSRR